MGAGIPGGGAGVGGIGGCARRPADEPGALVTGAVMKQMNDGGAAEVASALAFDRAHLWHPYTSMRDPLPVQPVVAAHGTRLVLADGRELIDGMSFALGRAPHDQVGSLDSPKAKDQQGCVSDQRTPQE